MIVKIDSHKGLHSGGEDFLVAQDLRHAGSVKGGLAHQKIEKVVHGAHLCIVGHTRELREQVLFTVDFLELLRLTINLL